MFCKELKSASEIMHQFDLERSYFRRYYLDKIVETGKLKRTKPENRITGIKNIILKSWSVRGQSDYVVNIGGL